MSDDEVEDEVEGEINDELEEKANNEKREEHMNGDIDVVDENGSGRDSGNEKSNELNTREIEASEAEVAEDVKRASNIISEQDTSEASIESRGNKEIIDNPEVKSGGEEGTTNGGKRQRKTRPRPVLKLDEISEEFRHVTFGKLDRLTKATRFPNDPALFTKHNDATLIDNAIAKWTLAVN